MGDLVSHYIVARNRCVSLISRSHALTRTTAQARATEVDVRQYNMAKVQPSKDGGNSAKISHCLVDFIIKCKVGRWVVSRRDLFFVVRRMLHALHHSAS